MENFKIAVRALLALGVVGVVSYMAIIDKVSGEAIVGIAMYVIQFYFNGDNKPKEENKNENINN